jgi:biotin operon repressor
VDNRDRALLALRRAGNRGLSQAELAAVAPLAVMHVESLRLDGYPVEQFTRDQRRGPLYGWRLVERES